MSARRDSRQTFGETDTKLSFSHELDLGVDGQATAPESSIDQQGHKMRHGSMVAIKLASVVTALLVASCHQKEAPSQGAGAPPLVNYVDQGQDWTPAARHAFYGEDQGSEIMPIAWARALEDGNGRPFLADGLARYGYLGEEKGNELPIGFTTGTHNGTAFLGMSCAACHTRQLQVDGKAYRIDGGPALSDFQSFLHDLDTSMGMVLTDATRFDHFAVAVLGPDSVPAARAGLKSQVAAWYHRQHSLFSRALPAAPWGVGRLDAVSMIFDRVTGLDIGSSPDGMIANNIQSADAPVRYPFIWDAAKQDHTQWPGFATNGDVVLGLARNLGEVYGVFADFHPVPNHSLLGYDYQSRNSADFQGLDQLESLVRRIGAPRWPWPLDRSAVQRGHAIFASNCASCHEAGAGKLRLLPLSPTWRTRLEDVGTDSREYDVLARTADSGVLRNAVYKPGHRLAAQDSQFHILAAAVIGSLAQRFADHGLPEDALIRPIRPEPAGPLPLHDPVKMAQQELLSAYDSEASRKASPSTAHPYEARVLHGVWAAAPYLHNGSVASLRDLLTPPEARPAAFAVGPAFDPGTVGLASKQPAPIHIRTTTGCGDLRSGNSRCGHDYGTHLADNEKADLIEFLKQY